MENHGLSSFVSIYFERRDTKRYVVKLPRRYGEASSRDSLESASFPLIDLFALFVHVYARRPTELNARQVPSADSRDRHGHVQTLLTSGARKYMSGRPMPIACAHAMLCAFRRPAVKVERVAARGQRPGIVLAPCDRNAPGRMPGGDRETRCPPPCRPVRYTGSVRAGPNCARRVPPPEGRPVGRRSGPRRRSIFQFSPRQDRSQSCADDHARPTRPPPRHRGLSHRRRAAPQGAGQGGLRSTADWRPERAGRAEEPAGGRASQLRAPGRLYGKSFRITGRGVLFFWCPPSFLSAWDALFPALRFASNYFTFLSSSGKIRGSVRGESYYTF